MEDTRDKRPVYMSTFQKRTDKLKSEIKSELDEFDDKIAIIDRKLSWFFSILLISIIIILVSHFVF